MIEAVIPIVEDIRGCTRCRDTLPLPPRPILQASANSKILIAGQAPGRKARDKGIPFDDASGNRLRDWLGVSRETFYDPAQFAVVPMGFCFPGTGKGGDLAPLSICAETWHEALLAELRHVALTLVIGQYAMAWHMPDSGSVTQTVLNWRDSQTKIPLPHPSPRNNRWLKQNPWFEQELLPDLKKRVSSILSEGS